MKYPKHHKERPFWDIMYDLWLKELDKRGRHVYITESFTRFVQRKLAIN